MCISRKSSGDGDAVGAPTFFFFSSKSLTKLAIKCFDSEVQFHRFMAPPNHKKAEKTVQSDTQKRELKILGE